MFYMTLPSNSSEAHFPNNTPGHYSTQLPQPIRLDGDYEVGLSEIQFSSAKFNIEDDQCSFTLRIAAEIQHPTFITATFPGLEPIVKPTLESPQMAFKAFKVPGAMYQSPKHLLETIEKLIYEWAPGRGRLRFSFNTEARRTYIKIKTTGSTLTLNPGLQRVLGYNTAVFGRRKGVFRSAHDILLRSPFQVAYIYSDLVEPRVVGDVMVPLLRTVPLELNKYSESNFLVFEKPHYIPLRTRQFNTIELFLTNGLGKEVSFLTGNTVATLHFRRVRAAYL